MRCDIAIIGSGFASYELARHCATRGLSVTVLEIGGLVPDPAAAVRSAVPFSREVIQSGGVGFGANVPPGFETAPRFIGLGGTSVLWSGTWRHLDRLDLQRERAGRKWPVSFDELTAWSRAVAEDYGWPSWSSDEGQREFRDLVGTCDLRLVEAWEQAPPLRLRPLWLQLQRAGAIRIACDTEVVGAIYTDDGDSLRGVRIRQGDEHLVVEAARFVVACGGIESVYVSHALRFGEGSPAARRGTPPAAYGGFMDHPKAILGEVRSGPGNPVIGHLVRRRGHGHLLGLALPEAEVMARSVGNHTVMLWPDPADARAPVRVVINLEQSPEPDNCVRTSPSRLVSWRVSRKTWDDCELFLDAFLPRLEELIGPLSRYPTLRFRGASHHLGALPMGTGADTVLDPNLRFRDVDNLYCASSAAFPVAGSANPTLTIIALARRLAHHLAGPR